MANNVNPEFVLTREVYKEDAFSSITDLSKARQLEGAWLSSVVTHMNYASSEFGKQNFPMLLQTEGMGNVKTVDNFEYKYGIIGRPKKTSAVAKSLYAATDKPGLGGSLFKIPFKERQFGNQQTLHARTSLGLISVRVQGDPIQEGDYWMYTVQLYGTRASYCPVSALAAGKIWGGGVFKVPFEDSYGVETKSYLPGSATNMTSLVRHTYKFKGNVQEYMMKYTIKANGQTFKLYTDWELFLADLEFAEQCEIDAWTSVYGKEEGKFLMFDSNTQVPITSGGGIRQQIPNKDTHSYLTYKQLTNIIRDITFNVGSDNQANIDVWSGTGGLDDIDEVLKNEMKGYTLVDTKMVSGDAGFDMVFGSFFKTFRHKDGHTVTFRKHPMFDRGLLGDISDKHPVSGLPKSSHDIYILDNTIRDGEANFQYVMEKGREYHRWAVMGAKVPKGMQVIDSRGSARDRSEIHGMKSQGIQIMNPTGLYMSECV